MGAGLQELVATWRATHAPDATRDLCDALADRGVADALVLEVARDAARQTPPRPDVLVAAGRAYLVVGEVDVALGLMLQAATLGPLTPALLAYLGEALLLRGDAKRATVALERSVAEGGGADAKLLLDRARGYRALQERSGPGAVTREVERTRGGTRASSVPSQATDAAAPAMPGALPAPLERELDETLTTRRPAPKDEGDSTVKRHPSPWLLVASAAGGQAGNEDKTAVVPMAELVRQAFGGSPPTPRPEVISIPDDDVLDAPVEAPRPASDPSVHVSLDDRTLRRLAELDQPRPDVPAPVARAGRSRRVGILVVLGVALALAMTAAALLLASRA